MELSEVKDVYYISNLYNGLPVRIVKTSSFTELEKDTIGNEIFYSCHLFREDDRHDVFLTFSEAREHAIYLSQRNIDASKLAIKNSEEKIELLKELKECQK